jgi:hypothetical protein
MWKIQYRNLFSKGHLRRLPSRRSAGLRLEDRMPPFGPSLTLWLHQLRSRWFGRRSRNNVRKTLPAVRQRVQLALESLEERTTPATISLSGVPTWVEQGPGPIQPPAFSPVAGAINAIAADPTNANRVFVATVNGGIWRTDDATDSNPVWTPLTDQYPSLSMGAIAFSPLDLNYKTLFAGTGHFSSGFSDGGPLTGLLRSTDGGNSWKMIDQGYFDGQNIQSIVPTAITTDRSGTLQKQVVLVGTNYGLYRSTDGGSTWAPISGVPGTGLPGGGVSDLVPDPANAQRFYAGIPSKGVYRSDDAGATWTAVDSGDLMALASTSERIRLSVFHDVYGTNEVWAGVISGNHVVDILRSPDADVSTQMSWRAMAHPGDPSGGLISRDDSKFSMVADRTNPNVVWVGGDYDPTIGFVARILRGDFGTNHWNDAYSYPSIPNYAGTPHSDSRNMVFDANGNLLECDDGGIYRLNNPDNFLGLFSSWSSVNGNIRPTEFYSVAYDPINHVIIGGAQDNGSPAQSGSGNFAWGWGSAVSGGDGGIAQVTTETASTVNGPTTIPVSVVSGKLP